MMLGKRTYYIDMTGSKHIRKMFKHWDQTFDSAEEAQDNIKLRCQILTHQADCGKRSWSHMKVARIQ